ncbi:NAD(P)-binding protein [Falsibacillus albus]|uniref:precorrin-2 dehydrogenase n=1 Tax=Falsibacillus albus TaxID=2478915 RepID=A0A3L7K597_9BACI|nr:NAD(P)-binding protein [Falsibacillus albus]RLQ95882.1 NAD(P)-binding protein [Falsibacillus albus]
MYPITLDLTNKKVLVAGGGEVALRKIKRLLKAGAFVTVVSPEAVNGIESLYLENKIRWVKNKVVKEDFADAFLIIAATNDNRVNRDIVRHAGENKLVNVASSPEDGNFHVPATLQRGSLLLSVSTGGASPSLAMKIRDDLSDIYGENYDQYVRFLQECRECIKSLRISKEEKKEYLNECLEGRFVDCVEERKKFKEKLMVTR